MISAIAVVSTPGFAGGLDSRSEILFADSKAAVLRADVATGTPDIIANGNKLNRPFGLAVAQNGELLVSDTGCRELLGINPATGAQRSIASGTDFGIPFGIAVERSGMVLVANGQALVRVNPVTGDYVVAYSQGYFKMPIGVAVGDNGDIFVVDITGAVIHVDAKSGSQTVISSGELLHAPQGIAVKGNNIYVTTVADPMGNFGTGRVVQIDANTGIQAILSEGNHLVGPVGIAIEGDGHIIVSDPYTVNPETNEYDGAIIRIDKITGDQSPLAHGESGFVNPRGVAVVSK